MGDKEFNGDIKEDPRAWWEDYDGDIEEERREIIERASKIEDEDQREYYRYCAFAALEYDEYFANQPHFKCESSLISLRRYYLGGYEDENTDDFIDRILRHTNMKRTPCPYKQNILVVNGNNKFTFLNTSKLIPGDKLDREKILEKGKKKLRREYSKEGWKEGDDDNEKKFAIVCVSLRGYREDEDSEDEDRGDEKEDNDTDDEKFKRMYERLKAQYF